MRPEPPFLFSPCASCVPAPGTAMRPRTRGSGTRFFLPASSAKRLQIIFRVRLETTAGVFVIEVHRDWAPLGADRFYNLVKRGWYDGVRFHRVLEDFTAGWGIHDDPYVNRVWQNELLVDDPVVQSNTRGRVSFARSGANSRTTHVFVNFKDNSSLDDRFAPFGEVVEGMDVVDGLFAGYGDGPPRGDGVYQARALAQGAEYFDLEFPELDRIERAMIL